MAVKCKKLLIFWIIFLQKFTIIKSSHVLLEDGNELLLVDKLVSVGVGGLESLLEPFLSLCDGRISAIVCISIGSSAVFGVLLLGKLEELIKDKVASFTTTLLDSEKKEVEKKHKKSHKKHSKVKKEAKKAESEDDSESEHEQEQKKKTKKKHHKKEKAPESDNEEEEEKPKHHKKHHHVHKHHEKANDEKKEEETPSLEDLAKMISTLQKE